MDATLRDCGGWSVAADLGGVRMAARPDKYYRAGHWVNRSAGGGKPAKKSMTGLIVVGLLAVGAWLG